MLVNSRVHKGSAKVRNLNCLQVILLSGVLSANFSWIVSLRCHAADTSYVQNLVSLSKDNNYLGDLDTSMVDCWPPSRIPIKVFIHPANNLAGYKEAYSQILRQSFEDWTIASDHKITFEFVKAVPADGIEVTWEPKGIVKSSEEAGGSAIHFSDRTGISRATIVLHTFPDNKEMQEDTVIKSASLHEIGHALGIAGHSSDKKDLLSAKISLTTDTKLDEISLSPRDKNTILALLTLGPRREEIASSQETFDLVNSSADDINNGRYQQAIPKLQRCLKLDPNCESAKDNLVTCYGNFAQSKFESKDYAEAAILFKERLKLLESRPKVDKKQLYETLNTYVFCMEKIGKFKDAAAEGARLNTFK